MMAALNAWLVCCGCRSRRAQSDKVTGASGAMHDRVHVPCGQLPVALSCGLAALHLRIPCSFKLLVI
jgi:hypothetical protein